MQTDWILMRHEVNGELLNVSFGSNLFITIKPLTFAVGFGSVAAAAFPVFSYCQNMEFGYGKDYAKGGQMNWYNYIIPTSRKRYSENDASVEKLRQELFQATNKSK